MHLFPNCTAKVTIVVDDYEISTKMKIIVFKITRVLTGMKEALNISPNKSM